jgi:hypothetical protein
MVDAEVLRLRLRGLDDLVALAERLARFLA